jgi:DNA-binding NarL/FixJ family response regulator
VKVLLSLQRAEFLVWTLTRRSESVGLSLSGRGYWSRRNLESRAEKRALGKVPHLQSSPLGRGEEAIPFHRERRMMPRPVVQRSAVRERPLIMESQGRIRVLLADDHRILREALKMVLAAECDVVGEAANGEQAVALAAQLKPQVVVMDVGMPGIGGLAAIHRIGKEAPACKVLVLSQYDDEEYVLEALTEAGAAGYVVKTDAAVELVAAVRAVNSGRRYLSPSIAPIVLAQLRKPVRAGVPANPRLTRREREVLKLIGEGATTKDVAQRLGISPKTAQAHRENLKQKLGLRTTAGMVRYAIKHKVIRVD